jgi:hypothetical protein
MGTGRGEDSPDPFRARCGRCGTLLRGARLALRGPFALSALDHIDGDWGARSASTIPRLQPTDRDTPESH